jgi:phosphoribosylanthranilate isomerase
MRVKICGITRLEDALTAVSLGADMLGFNFYPGSKRYVTPQAAAALIREMKAALERDRMVADHPVANVGIFVNTPPAQIRTIMEQCGLDLAQLSGDEPPQDLEALGGRGFKAIRPSSPAEAAQLAAQFARPAAKPAFLIDAYHPEAYGGTGETGDWTLAARFAAAYPLMLAGGLTPQNVETAARQVKPWGVDVASGVESAPGVKDSAKMDLFIKQAKSTLIEN